MNHLSYFEQGRSGTITFQNSETLFDMYYEFGGGNCVVTIFVPSPEQWENKTGLSLETREITLHQIGKEVVKDKLSNGKGFYTTEGNFIHLYGK